MNKLFSFTNHFSKNNSLLKFNKNNFSNTARNPLSNKDPQQQFRLYNLIKKSSIQKIIVAILGSFSAAYFYFGTACLFEDNNGAKKYQRLRNFNYILGGCFVFTVIIEIDSNYFF